jgi:hypothetical protein
MPQAVDVLNSSLQHLLPKFEELFLEGHPITDELLKGGSVEKIQGKGPYLEFTVLKGHPGAAVGIRNGNELIQSTRRNNALRGNEYAYRCIYHWDVPRKDLAECSGPMDFARIIDNYPKAALGGHMQAFARQLARGSASSGSDADGTALDGFLTLNGQQDYYPQSTATGRDGVFQFTTTQTNTVHGLPMSGAASSPTPNWDHQFADIDNFSTSGMTTARTLAKRASMEGGDPEGGTINLYLSDEMTFHNVISAQQQFMIVNDKIASPANEKKYTGRSGIPFNDGVLYWEPAIDLSDTTSFSGVALDGVMYGLNTKYWGMFVLGNNSKLATKGFFELSEPIRSPNQDAYHYEIVSYFNLFCRSLRHQMAMTGGAVL